MTAWDRVSSELAAVLGAGNVLRLADETAPYAADRWASGACPPAVFLPGTAAEVACVVRTLAEAALPFVARGRGTGMTGGALPLGKAAVISLERLNRILSIRPEAFEAEVEPGVILADLQRAVAAAGLFYPPDPASADECSIGGNIAENAGGLSCVKYGVTGDYVLALDVVLPSGRLVTLGSHARKDVAGFDLKRLVIGSEGMLAIVTRAVLRLVPRPAATRTFAAWFSDAARAIEALHGLMLAGIVPARAELIGSACLRILADDGVPVPAAATALLLLALDGSEAALADERLLVAEKLRDRTVLFEEAAGPDEERLWLVRTRLSPALKKLAPMKINEDIAVPLDRQADFIRFVEALAARTGLLVAVFGHAGDGNLHVNLMIRPEELSCAHAAVGELFGEAIRLGGTLTGEHGIGIAKAPWAELRLDATTLELSRAIKDVFDPQGLLNPGKAFYGAVPDPVERLV